MPIPIFHNLGNEGSQLKLPLNREHDETSELVELPQISVDNQTAIWAEVKSIRNGESSSYSVIMILINERLMRRES